MNDVTELDRQVLNLRRRLDEQEVAHRYEMMEIWRAIDKETDE